MRFHRHARFKKSKIHLLRQIFVQSLKPAPVKIEPKIYTFNKKFFEKIVYPRACGHIFFREEKNLILVMQVFPSKEIRGFLEKPTF